jgi:hypothetical protein
MLHSLGCSIFVCDAAGQIGPSPPPLMFLDHTNLDTQTHGRTLLID